MNLREDTARGDADLLDRFDSLQTTVSVLSTEHGITRSNVERAERVSKETSLSCRQILDIIPDARDICRWSELDAMLGPKINMLLDESQKKVTLLVNSVSEELARSIPSQIAAQTRNVLNIELESFREQLGRQTDRLTSLENNASVADSLCLDEANYVGECYWLMCFFGVNLKPIQSISGICSNASGMSLHRSCASKSSNTL